MKLELSIKADYLPSWGMWHGIRELIQNARDAEFELGAPMTVESKPNALIIENDGCVLPHEALLLGHSTKVGKAELIGRFGEGLKLGILALVRSGVRVTIRSGSEVWIPKIQRSEKFKVEVLVFDITKGRKDSNRVSIELLGIDAELWEAAKWKFLFLNDEHKPSFIETDSGALLTDPVHKGHVFVKGIYVHTDRRFDYGYNFKNAELDRDRQMVDRWDFMVRSRELLTAAFAKRPDLIDGFVATLERQGPEVEGFSYAEPDEGLAKAVSAAFQARHGADAIPVRTLADSKDLDHLGKKGVVVGEAHAKVLSGTMQSLDAVRASLKEETLRTYGWHELSDTEKKNISESVDLIHPLIAGLKLDVVQVVDFRSPDILGLHGEGLVKISKKVVDDPEECLSTMVHEAAHMGGFGDGEVQHVRRIEAIWAGIVKTLRTQLTKA